MEPRIFIITWGNKAPESRFRLCFLLLLLGAVKRPIQGFASVFCYYYLYFLCFKFPELCSVTKPKLGLSLGTKSGNLLHLIFSAGVRVELEDIDQERLDNINTFWLFFFLFICLCDLHYTDTSLLSKRRLISRVQTQKLLLKLKLAEDTKLRRK